MKPGLRHILPWLVLAAACCVPAQRAGVERPVSEPAPVRVRLLFAGDVMQHFPQVTAARCGDGFDYRGVFAYLRRRFHAADLVVVNLETTLTRTDRYTGYPCFRSPVALADALRDAGVDVAVLANNHCCDGGAAGVHTTVAELGRCGILHTGVFTDSLDRAANNPLWVERYGVRFALLNYTYGTNGIPVPAGVEVNLIDTARMAADLAAARRGAPDCVAVCIHWGNEYERRENAVQRHLAQFLRRHGADLVVGSHPHVVQPFDAGATATAGWWPKSRPCGIPTGACPIRLRRCPSGWRCRATASSRPKSGTRWRFRKPMRCSGKTWRRCSAGPISNPNSPIKTNNADFWLYVRDFIIFAIGK